MQSLAERRSAQLKCINSFNSGSRIIITKGVHTFTKIFTNHAYKHIDFPKGDPPFLLSNCVHIQDLWVFYFVWLWLPVVWLLINKKKGNKMSTVIISNNWYTEYITPKSMVSSKYRTHPGRDGEHTLHWWWRKILGEHVRCSLQEMSLLAAFPILCLCSLNIIFYKTDCKKEKWKQTNKKRLHNTSAIGKQCFNFNFSLV